MGERAREREGGREEKRRKLVLVYLLNIQDTALIMC